MKTTDSKGVTLYSKYNYYLDKESDGSYTISYHEKQLKNTISYDFAILFFTNRVLQAKNIELLEVLNQVNKTLHNHGHMDADTGLHSKIEEAIKKATN